MSPVLRESLTEPAASMSKPKSQIVDSGKFETVVEQFQQNHETVADLTTKVNFL